MSKQVSVTGSSFALALLGFALGSKTSGVETAALGSDKKSARDLIPSGKPFKIDAMIHFVGEGVVGDDTTAPKPYAFSWINMLALALAAMGATENHTRRILAAMVGWQRAHRKTDEEKGKGKGGCPKSDPNAPDTLTQNQLEWITAHSDDLTVRYQDGPIKTRYGDGAVATQEGAWHTLDAITVGQLGIRAMDRLAEIEDVQDAFARQLMEDRLQRGSVRFDTIICEAMTLGQPNQDAERASA